MGSDKSASSRKHPLQVYLQQELRRRCRVNPKYSLRSFARALGLEASYLSKVLAGKRAITSALVHRLGSRLGLSPEQIEYFEDPINRMLPMPFNKLKEDEFRLISDWYHYAILELVRIDGFDASAASISLALQISEKDSVSAVDRLLRLRLLEKNAEGRLINCSGNNTTTGNPFTNFAFRNLQGQVLSLSKVALETIPISKRDHSSMTMAVDSDLLPEAKKRIRDFRRSLCQFLEGGEKKNAVYQLSISLFPSYDGEESS